ncbi:CAP domain-containing protein [Micromonospora sp. CCTCC AA 2012012]|uniref:CAP domain-containing protein n=1 Tax=Micromonospora sp. CCTCC AA 2012012 TaxID=3111921 RepID=A0AAU7M1K8_9ACTN
MYGWTDPIDPEGAPRRPEPPTDQPPAWLTDRPEPRSSYLFGDEPQEPTGAPRWQSEPTGRLPHPVAPFERAGHPVAPFERAAQDRTGELPYPVAPFERAAHDRTAPVDLTAVRGAGPDGSADGRHRNGRRFPRPLLIGGAAAAATLVVSLGVGALVLPNSDPRSDATAAVDDTVAAAPAVPDTSSAPADALAAPSPTTSPSATRPSPTPSRTVKPVPSRTTAASRDLPRSSAPSTTRAKTTSTTTGTGITAELQKVVDLVNAERAKAGCRALSVNSKLMTAAQRHSQDQADHRTMTHTGSDGSKVGQRLDRVGYAWRGYGENVAWGQPTPAEVMRDWMNSQGHRDNILNCSFTQIGVGVARSNGPYWTQDFGTPR